MPTAAPGWWSRTRIRHGFPRIAARRPATRSPALRGDRGRSGLTQQVDDALVEAGLHFIALGCAGNVSDHDLQATTGGAQFDRGLCRELLDAILRGNALPILLGLMNFGLGFTAHNIGNLIGEPVAVPAGRHRDLQLVPKPLAVGGEIEEVALDGEAVQEGDAAAGGMT